MAYLTNLVKVCERTGYPVKVVSGWKSRGRSFGTVSTIVCHHTAGPKSGNMPSLGVITNGRPGLSGPLANLGLGRDGTIYVVAAGVANHAGVVKNASYANSRSIGIEAEATGTTSWPAKQMDAYAKLCNELRKAYKLGVGRVLAHKEVCSPKGRKIDPNFNMATFRSRVSGATAGPSKPPPAKPQPGGKAPKLRVDYFSRSHNARVADVRVWQRQMKARGWGGIGAIDGIFGAKADTVCRQFQREKKLGVDGKVGPKTWSASWTAKVT